MKIHLLIVAVLAPFLLASCADQPAAAGNQTAASTNPARSDYSRSELQRSGRQTTGEAIQATDPSVTISSGSGSGAHP